MLPHSPLLRRLERGAQEATPSPWLQCDEPEFVSYNCWPSSTNRFWLLSSHFITSETLSLTRRRQRGARWAKTSSEEQRGTNAATLEVEVDNLNFKNDSGRLQNSLFTWLQSSSLNLQFLSLSIFKNSSNLDNWSVVEGGQKGPPYLGRYSALASGLSKVRKSAKCFKTPIRTWVGLFWLCLLRGAFK